MQTRETPQGTTTALPLRTAGRVHDLRNATFAAVASALGLSLLVVAALIVYELARESRDSLAAFGWGFLTSTEWDPVAEVFGAAPAIYGTLVSSFIALLIAVPLSIGAAIFLSEIAPHWLRAPLSFLVEMLAALPSVVLGLWGLYVLVPWIREPLEVRLHDYLGFLPLFEGPPLGVGMLAGGIILAIMIFPIITAISRDVMAAVPNVQREAMLALGATRWEAIRRAVLPYCRSGLIGGAILGLGRAMGETMAVTMVIGKNYDISTSLFRPASTVASTLASEFNEATSDLYISALVELGLILMGLTLLVNVAARLLVWRFARAVEVRE